MRIPHLAALCLFACGGGDSGDSGGDSNEPESLTTAVLLFTPQIGGSPVEFRVSDQGGGPVVLPHVGAYQLQLQFLDEGALPEEDRTDELEEESGEHQVFLTGAAVVGPATGANSFAIVRHAYTDTDSQGFELGLVNAITTLGTGSAQLTLTLQHLAEDAGVAVKTADLATRIATDGMDTIPGTPDLALSFELEVVAP